MKFLQIYFARFKLQHCVLKLDYPKLSKHTTKIKISASQMSTTSWSHFEVHNSSIVVYVYKFQNRNQQHPLKIINWASTSVKSYFIQYLFQRHRPLQWSNKEPHTKQLWKNGDHTTTALFVFPNWKWKPRNRN